MKIPTSEAAKKLAVHPANVILFVSGMVERLEDCWPEIGDDFVETIGALRAEYPASVRPKIAKAEAESPRTEEREALSPTAARILDKLERQDFWGGRRISLDAIHNLCAKGAVDVKDAIRELKEVGFLVEPEGKRGSYSLNSNRRLEVRELLERRRAAVRTRG
jgi:hypothetical protein